MRVREILPPNLPLLVLLAFSVIASVAAFVVLVRAGLGGIIPILPIAAAGLYLIWRWWKNRMIVKDERRKTGDLDQELRRLIEGNYL
jgi:4-hydroxybenzoate polyprenyltransferase